MKNAMRRAQIASGLLAAIVLSGCGVKNLPEAPDSNLAPAEAVEPEQAGGVDIIGGDSGNDAEALIAGARIESTGDDDDDRISVAEVTRNPTASRRSFFLDPLLN